jgi:hypothetical protein
MIVVKDDELAFGYVDIDFWQEMTVWLLEKRIQSKAMIVQGIEMDDVIENHCNILYSHSSLSLCVSHTHTTHVSLLNSDHKLFL